MPDVKPLKLGTGRPQQFGSTDSAALSGVSLDAISTTVSGTAVATFVYDTRNDSDGGAWRKRCQHTSWYNETLNTATRGATREFPAVALIVATASSVTIYDATVSSCPMWMVFNATSYNFASANHTGILATNGIIYLISSTGGLRVCNLLKDFIYACKTGYTYISDAGSSVSLRNTAGTAVIVISSAAIVADSAQCITATILPTAPIDSATGLPIPTVWVGTLGGVSRIAHDGTVSNWTESGSVDDVYNIGITGDYVYWSTYNSSFQNYIEYYSIYANLTPFTYLSGNYITGNSSHSYTSNRLVVHYQSTITGIQDITRNAIATNRSLTIIQPNTTTWGNGLHATITKDFNTGYQFGDIRGAWLCNATAETLTAASLVTGDSSTFTSGVGSWVGDAGSSVTTVSGELQVTTIATYGTASVPITCVVGKTYVVSCICRRGTSDYVSLRLSGEAYNTRLYTHTTNTAVSFTFTATSVNYSVVAESGTAGTIFFDDITVKLADPDYSYKNSGLEVVGSLTKAAVATGAELVGYSGFSTSNYLREAYNSAKDFSTTSFNIRFWLKCAATAANETILERDSASIAQRFTIEIAATTSYISFTCDDNTTTRTATSSVAVDDGLWHFYECIYDGAGGVYIYRDGSSTAFASATGAALLTLNNASATFTVGATANATLPLTSGTLSLLHIGAGNPSATQQKTIYEAERPLFQANAKCLLAGTSNDVKAVDYDRDTNTHHAVTGDYYNAFKGLQRVDLASGVWTSVSAKNNLVIKGA